MEDLELRKKEFKDRLTNELFIERYDSFKESIILINMALESFRIDYQYTYDQFCIDYTNECMEYMDNHPDVDMMDPTQLYFYTLPIVMSIVEKAKNKYGIKK